MEYRWIQGHERDEQGRPLDWILAYLREGLIVMALHLRTHWTAEGPVHFVEGAHVLSGEPAR